MSLGPGDLIGVKYRIVRLIGDGGMGSVYEARHELLGVAVALKFLHKDLAQRPGLSARFLQEARVSATIQSPHVARVTDVDTAQDGSPYLVMELLTGESLQRVLDRQRKLLRDQAIDFALQTLAGLEAAHARGVVHRDLKPDNVFVTQSGGGPLLKLIDFGIAKLRESSEYKKALTRAGVVMGTPEYMAPEQLYAASEVDHRADLYSLGVMLFEMLSGQRPADGDSAEDIVAKVLSGNTRRLAALEPDLPPELCAAVERALVADREQRFANAYEMRATLARFSGELSHAGRLAATPSPASAGPAHSPDAAGTAFAPPPDLANTLDAPGPAKVADTLPPEPQDFARSGGTQAAAAPYPPGPPRIATTPNVSPDPRRGRRRRGRGLFALAVVVALMAGGLVLAQALQGSHRSIEPISGAGAPAAAGTTGVEPIVIPDPTSSPDPLPGSPNDITPRQTPGRATGTGPSNAPRDAGTTPVFPGPLPFPSFALPSSLPPLPSQFPPLPTSLPTGFPSILPQIPGFSPPPAPVSPDGGR